MAAPLAVALLVLLSLLLALLSAYRLLAMLSVWEDCRPPDRAPRTFTTPRQRFTLVLTARRDPAVVEAAIHRVVALRYPRELVQALVVLEATDTATIVRAREALAALLRQGRRNVRLLVIGEPPFSRPRALNVGLRAATGDIVAAVDSGDELHPDILNVVNTVVARAGAARAPVIRCGCLSTGRTNGWLARLRLAEPYFWSWGYGRYQAAAGVVPLGGGTAFVSRELLRRLGGWDERGAAEDADLSIRLTAERVPVRLVADHEYATRRRAPATVAQLIRQRTHRDQGFLRLVAAGTWRRLPSLAQRLVVLSTLVSPLLPPLAVLYALVGLGLLLSGRLPVGAAMASSLPLYAVLLHLGMQITGSRQLARASATTDDPPPPGLGVGTRRTETALVLLLLIVALLAHGINLFDSTAARDDEGIYTARAWAVLRGSRLAPAAGGYDQAPAGWLLLAGWMAATGGPLAFGDALDSGRAAMLVLHLGMVVLLYRVARRLGCGAPAAALACLLFSVSPLAVAYQRLVLSDTIMLFWVLLSLDLALDDRGRLGRMALSGACFGLACLSNETASVLAPALLLVVWHRRQGRHERIALASWLALVIVVVSWYPLYAALAGELRPPGQWLPPLVDGWTTTGAPWAGAPRWPALPASGGAFNFNFASGFWRLVRWDWLARDPILLVGGSLATGVNLLRGGAPRHMRDPRALVTGFLAILPLLSLGRAGAVQDFQILLAVPFLCLSVAVALGPLLARPRDTPAAAVAVLLASALAAGYWEAGTLQPLYAQRPGAVGREATAWIKQNLPAESRIIAPVTLWTDLHEPGAGGPAFANADSAPASTWQAADYLVVAADAGPGGGQAAPDTAHLVRRWQRDGATVALWRAGGAGATESALLARSAGYMAGRFERAGAYVAADGSVSSESQADALLRAVWSGDRAGFASTWAWTAAHMLRADGLPAWLWRNGAIVDPHSASDADVDLALALLMAGRRWHEPALVTDGTRLVQAIWEREVVLVAGAPTIAAGEWAADDRAALVPVNPSYFAPYAYRVFQEADPAHDWSAVVDAGYRTLFALSRAPLGGGPSAGLPPDWVGLDRTTGAVAPLAMVGRSDMTGYGYDAPRTYWRVALDLRWTGDPRADAYLRQADLLRQEVSLRGAPGSAYTHAGALVDARPSMVGTAGALAALLTVDPAAADALYAGQVLGRVEAAGAGLAGAAWADRGDLYDQTWGWFATALYADALRDLWHAA